MKSKKKANMEITLKNILYFLESEEEQNKAIVILEKCESQMPDSGFKNFLDKGIYKTKRSYYDKVDFLVNDILSGNHSDEDKAIIQNMIDDFKPAIEKGQSNFWDLLKNIMNWS